MTERPILSRWALAAAVVGACALLVHNTARVRKERLWQLEYRVGLDGQRFSMASWRFWDDMGVGISRYLDRLAPPLPPEPDPGPMIDAYREILERRTRDEGILPHQFWRTVSPRPFLRGRVGYTVPALEDPGRPVLIAAAFLALGGVSPYLLIWVGTLFCIPVFAWVVWEAREAGHAVAGVTLVLLSSVSCFVVECLSLAHSAVGFYLAAVFGLIALGFYATRGRGTSIAGYLTRLAAAAGLFAVGACARGTTFAMAPAFLLVLLLAGARVAAASPSRAPHGARRWLAALAVCVAFLTPYQLVKPAARHNIWLSLWQGLADFAADRGYSWHDRDLKRFLVRSGLPEFEHPRLVSAEQEEFARAVVQGAIKSDPAWYAGILVKRTLATVSLAKLWPWGPRDGLSIEPPVFHFKYVVPIDFFGVGEERFELPVTVLGLPTAVLFGILARRARGGSDHRSRLRAYALIAGVLAVATLPVPVLVSTAAGMETQAFGLLYFLGFALLVDESVRSLRARLPSRVPAGERDTPGAQSAARAPLTMASCSCTWTLWEPGAGAALASRPR